MYESVLAPAAIFAAGKLTLSQITAEVVTHLIAFLIVVWVLKRYAWQPILEVIDERRNKIAADFEKADELQVEATEARQRYETALRIIEEEARQKTQEAIDEGRRIAGEIQQKARDDADAILERARANAEIELDNARKQLRRDVVGLTLSATEAILREQMDQATQRRQIDRFIDDLGGLK